MMPLSEDEIVKRFNYFNVADQQDLRGHLWALAEAGLSVVDLAESPPVHDPPAHDPFTYHEPTADCIWALGDPTWCNTHGRYGKVHGRHRTAAVDAVADLVAWLDSCAEAHRHVPGITAKYTAAADLIRVHSMAEPPPFPGAFPGPVVDGAPTWGAYLRDVPSDDTWQWSHGDWPDWVPGADARGPAPSTWVLARRSPKATAEQVIAQYLQHAPEQGDWPDDEHAEGVASGVLGALTAAGYCVVVDAVVEAEIVEETPDDV
jgi:hypothetical protein